MISCLTTRTGPRGPKGPYSGPQKPPPRPGGRPGGGAGAVFDNDQYSEFHRTAQHTAPPRPYPEYMPYHPEQPVPSTGQGRVLTPVQTPVQSPPPGMPTRPPTFASQAPEQARANWPPPGSIPVHEPQARYPPVSMDMGTAPGYPADGMGTASAYPANMGGLGAGIAGPSSRPFGRRVSFHTGGGLARPREDEERRGEPEAGAEKGRRDVSPQ